MCNGNKLQFIDKKYFDLWKNKYNKDFKKMMEDLDKENMITPKGKLKNV